MLVSLPAADFSLPKQKLEYGLHICKPKYAGLVSQRETSKLATIKKIHELASALSEHRFVKPLISTLDVLEKTRTVREIIEHLDGLSFTAFTFVWVRSITAQTAILISMALATLLAIIMAILSFWSRRHEECEARSLKRARRRAGR